MKVPPTEVGGILRCGTRVAELPARLDLCLKTKQQENLNGRTTQRNFGRRRRVEIWRRVYLNDPDLYYRVLVTWLRSLLVTKRHKNHKNKLRT